jgi:hypothetical protein
MTGGTSLALPRGIASQALLGGIATMLDAVAEELDIAEEGERRIEEGERRIVRTALTEMSSIARKTARALLR